MNQENKIIIPFSQESTVMAMIIVPIIAIFLFFYIFPYFNKIELLLNDTFAYSTLSHIIAISFFTVLVLLSLKFFLYKIMDLFIVSVVYTPFTIFSKGVLAMLDEKGIWVKNFGFIPWDNIVVFKAYRPTKRSLTGIGIMVKNTLLLSKQSNIRGKFGIFWAKFFGLYHITILVPLILNESIIVFAQHHMDKS